MHFEKTKLKEDISIEYKVAVWSTIPYFDDYNVDT